MSTDRDNILENGHWEEIKQDTKTPTNIRATKWVPEQMWPSLSMKAGGPRKPIGRTGYLDGLRGFAALLVYWQHHEGWARNGSKVLESSFGYDNKYHFACLPGIRTFFQGGHFAVTVFFVISGYVLSAKPMSLIHAGEYVKLGDNLGSALFRRWIRLYLPVVCATFLYMASWHAFGIWTDSEEHERNFGDELWKWYCEFKNFSFVFQTGGKPWFSYDVHVWSIPVEFRGSILIYTSLMAFSRCTKNARLWCQVGLIFYFMYIADGWYGSMFMAGMLLCDLDLLAQSNNLPRFLSRLEPIKDLIFYHFFVISIYLGGVPSFSQDIEVLRGSRGWYYLSFLKPQAVFDYKWFYLFWASTLLVASIPRIPWLKSFFENRFNQYLGRISFAFYLAHGPVLRILGDRLYAAVGWVRVTHAAHIPGWVGLFPVSMRGPLGLELAFLVPHLILLPFTLWLADVGTRVIDKPSVKFAQWLYRRTLAPAPCLRP